MVTCFLPAVGARDRRTGDIGWPGVVGHFWASTPYGAVNAWSLWFSSTAVIAGTNDSSRAGGFSIRCVQRTYREKSGLDLSNFVL